MTSERLELSRMEETRRQTQHRLDLIDRQIKRRMTALIPQLKPKHAAFLGGKAPDPSAFLARYRLRRAAITAERQPEIDELSRQLARQDAAISAFCERNGLHAYAASDGDGRIAPRPIFQSGLSDRPTPGRRSRSRKSCLSISCEPF